MADTFFADLVKQAESGVTSAAIAAGVYDTIVSSARPFEKSNMIFLTLQVLNGPLAGQESDVSIWFPKEDSSRSARMYFIKKIGGFIVYTDIKSAAEASANAPSREAAFELMATTFVGKKVIADIGLVTEGDYAGSNELRSTRPVQSVVQSSTPAVAAAAQEFAPAPQTAPADNGVVAPF